MAVLLKRSPAPATVLAVREVRAPITLERRHQVHRFYAELLGLPPWPHEQQIPGGWGAGCPRRGVYFAYRHDAKTDPMRRRLVIQVQSLGDVEQKLHDGGCTFHRETGLYPCDQRILVYDPVGHLVEVRQCRLL